MSPHVHFLTKFAIVLIGSNFLPPADATPASVPLRVVSKEMPTRAVNSNGAMGHAAR